MKNLLLTFMSFSILSSCSGGSGSSGGSAGTTPQPVVLSPAQDISSLPSSVVLRSDLCISNTPNSIDGAFYKVSFIKGANQEFDTIMEFFSNSSCSSNSITMTQAFLNDVLSSQKNGEDFVLTLSLVDVQFNIFSVDTLNSYNQGPLFETTWSVNNLVSVLGKKAYPADGGPAFILNSQSQTNIRVHVPEKIAFINNVKFSWQ